MDTAASSNTRGARFGRPSGAPRRATRRRFRFRLARSGVPLSRRSHSSNVPAQWTSHHALAFVSWWLAAAASVTHRRSRPIEIEAIGHLGAHVSPFEVVIVIVIESRERSAHHRVPEVRRSHELGHAARELLQDQEVASAPDPIREAIDDRFELQVATLERLAS